MIRLPLSHVLGSILMSVILSMYRAYGLTWLHGLRHQRLRLVRMKSDECSYIAGKYCNHKKIKIGINNYLCISCLVCEFF
jgi:hypothetical protein